ncbi:hypothetical protein R80B4_03117 [Fibrobacteres bacterium R8-0-B4]
MALLNRRGRALLFAAAVAAAAAGCSNKVTTAETTGAASADSAVSTAAAVAPDTADSAKPRHIDYGALTDARDGKTYRTITVGGKTWMAENLNYKSDSGGSSCLGGNDGNCEKFGRLYNNRAAQKACPAGWLLPSIEDWNALAVNVSGIQSVSPDIGKKMRAASGWEESGLVSGTDDSGFAALPGGSEPIYKDNAVFGAWWIARLHHNYYDVITLHNDTLHVFTRKDNIDRYSVRCVMDEGSPLTLTAGEGGTVSSDPDKPLFMDGETAVITAVPNSGYAFARWKAGKVANPDSAVTTIVARRDTKAAAVFRAIPGAVGTLSDKRDGRKYRTAQIGGQVWMAQNLNYRTGGSRCYNDNVSNCNKYGGLYDWNAAKKACPAGWHLPSDDEWTVLVKAINAGENNLYSVGNTLKAKEGWNPGDDDDDTETDGTDSYGFAALPGGGRAADNPGGGRPAGDVDGGKFYDIGDIGAWWTASESPRDSGSARFRAMYNLSYGLAVDNINKGYGLSVRCVKD